MAGGTRIGQKMSCSVVSRTLRQRDDEILRDILYSTASADSSGQAPRQNQEGGCVVDYGGFFSLLRAGGAQRDAIRSEFGRVQVGSLNLSWFRKPSLRCAMPSPSFSGSMAYPYNLGGRMRLSWWA